MIDDDHFFPAPLFLFPGINNCLVFFLVLYYYYFNPKLFPSALYLLCTHTLGILLIHLLGEFSTLHPGPLALGIWSTAGFSLLCWRSWFLYSKLSSFLIPCRFGGALSPITSWEGVYRKGIIWNLNCWVVVFLSLEVCRISLCSQYSEMLW